MGYTQMPTDNTVDMNTHTLMKNPLWALNKAWFSLCTQIPNLLKPIIKVKGCLFVFPCSASSCFNVHSHGEGIVAHKRKLECRSHHHTFILYPTMRENPPGCSLVSPQAPPLAPSFPLCSSRNCRAPQMAPLWVPYWELCFTRTVTVIDLCWDGADSTNNTNKAAIWVRGGGRCAAWDASTLMFMGFSVLHMTACDTKAHEAYLKCVLICTARTFFKKISQRCNHVIRLWGVTAEVSAAEIFIRTRWRPDTQCLWGVQNQLQCSLRSQECWGRTATKTQSVHPVINIV